MRLGNSKLRHRLYYITGIYYNVNTSKIYANETEIMVLRKLLHYNNKIEKTSIYVWIMWYVLFSSLYNHYNMIIVRSWKKKFFRYLPPIPIHNLYNSRIQCGTFLFINVLIYYVYIYERFYIAIMF